MNNEALVENLKNCQKTEKLLYDANYYFKLNFSVIILSIVISMLVSLIGVSIIAQTILLSMICILSFSVFDLANVQHERYSLYYIFFNKNYKIRNKIKKSHYTGSLSEIFDFDNEEVKKIILRHSKSVERSLIENKYISGSILIAIADEVAFMNKVVKEQTEQENKERLEKEETEALIKANTKVGISLKEIYKLQENAKVLGDK